jgi:hypothetical protein
VAELDSDALLLPLDALADPQVKAAIKAPMFELLVGFQLS